MNRKQAKEILALYRPGTADGQDLSFDKARRVAREDPELSQWFDSRCASYLAMREKFHDIPVPAGLQEQILSERQRQPLIAAEPKIVHPPFRKYAPVLAVAAAIILALILLDWRSVVSRRNDEAAYRAYRNRMISTATKAYTMALTTNDLRAINAFLQRRQAPANYVLPIGLQNARAVGCAIVPWDGKPVSMICFKTDRPLQPGQASDLWLFVAHRSGVVHAPASKSPALEQIDWVVTASWSDGDKTYLLAAPGDPPFLRSYL